MTCITANLCYSTIMSEQQTPTFYLFHGNDDLSIEEAVAKLRAGMGENGDFNTSEFDGQTASVPEIINAVTSFPFLADKRLVIVRGLVGWITRKGAGEPGKQALAYLSENVPILPDYARLVLVERDALKAGNAVVKLVEKNKPKAFVREFSVPDNTTEWISKRAEHYEATIEPRAAAALSEVTGDDLRRADNELVKLVSYAGGERAITEADVAALTPYVAQANIFKMVEAIADGRAQIALNLLYRLLSEKDEQPIRVFGMIVRQFRLLLLAREYLDAGGNPGEMVGAIKEVRWPGQARALAKQAHGFDIEQLERIYRRLQSLDQGMKTGEIKPELALDLFIAGVAR